MLKRYRHDLDILKGISILAILLYHIGLLPYGYLGVDTFLVINGFLIIPSLISDIANGNYHYGKWLIKRISRFLPIVIIALAVCLITGYFTMIPGDYENLAQSIFASGLFSNNILAAITTKNYWNTLNAFRPLMHFWYLGIVVQFYIVLPIILLCVRKLTGKLQADRVQFASLIAISFISFALYLLPWISEGDKFYYLPFRIWEFGIGGIIGIILSKKEYSLNPGISISTTLLLVVVFCLHPKSIADLNYVPVVGAKVPATSSLPKEVFLIVTVLLSSLLLAKPNREIFPQNIFAKCYRKTLSLMGKMSLSIFVWHQIMLAFMLYALIDEISIFALIVFFIILGLISYLSYRYIESIQINTHVKRVVIVISWAIILGVSFIIYLKAGVVRDVPELGITVKNPYVNRNTDFIDRFYSYDRPFYSDAKLKVLIVGNSFARDFASVLVEWDKNKILDISYKYSFGNNYDERYSECDYLFSFGSKNSVPSIVWESLKESCQVYGIGTKSYGKCFGRIYAKRHKANYYESKIPIIPLCQKTNEDWKKDWGENNFIDFMDVTRTEGDSIRLFTDNQKVISFDCKHLTEDGARFYAERLDLDRIFQNSNKINYRID